MDGNQFSLFSWLGPEDVAKMRRERLAARDPASFSPEGSAACTTAGGRKYRWGPGFQNHAFEWQDFILSLYGKNRGHIVHYGRVPSGDIWTARVSRETFMPPFNDLHAARLGQLAQTMPSNHGLILSGSLLADWLLWLRAHSTQKNTYFDVVFTTFEYFDPAWFPEFSEMFGAWCPYMRDWFSGFTWFGCRHGNLHTLDHICSAFADDQGQVVSTDLINKAADYPNIPTGIYGSLDDETSRCQCKLSTRNFVFDYWNNAIVTNTMGAAVNLKDLLGWPVGWQAVQERRGEVVALRPGPEGWNGRRDEQSRIGDLLSTSSIRPVFARGWVLKGSKKPGFLQVTSTPQSVLTASIHLPPDTHGDFGQL